MKILEESTVKKSRSSWPKLRQEEVNNCFEIYNEDKEEYNRITGMDYGTVSSGFLNGIKGWGANSSLTFNMAVNEAGLFTAIFELSQGGASLFYAPEAPLINTYVSPNHKKYQPHLGVSADYKNEVCTNWALIPYYMVSRIFFQTISLNGSGSGTQVDETQLLQRPKRVKKFIIELEDVQAMQAVLSTESSIKVHFGVNYGHSANQQIAFTPVIDISNNSGEAMDDDGGTYLDFVGACPPLCPPGGEG